MEKTRRLMLFVLSALLVCAETGCSRSSISDRHPLSVSPNVLDFGKVRPTDSPVKLTFDLLNHGDENVTVTDILSGCGCTVVDLPKESIPAHGQMSATVHVNVSGRFGVFENDLIIKTESQPDLRVVVRGNIETDIWADSQSLRCTVDPKEQCAATILTVYTAKYPDIVFADISQEDGVALQEISRVTRDGETAIRFSVEVDAKDKAIILRTITLVPRDASIAPLAIPLYCYRADEEI